MKAKIVSLCVFLLCIPAICFAGVLFFKERSVSFACTGIVILMLGAYFYVYEKKSSAAWELVIVALMSALSVVGRIVFAFMPSLKPCSAIIILTAVYFGRETGFMVGAFTALVSNFYFGQGGWTPFQMLAWGLTGYFAGMLGRQLAKNRILLLVYSAVIGVFFSLLMDLYSCLWMDGKVILCFMSPATVIVPATKKTTGSRSKSAIGMLYSFIIHLPPPVFNPCTPSWNDTAC